MSLPYQQTALSRLVSQFSQQPKIISLVKAMIAPFDQLSTALHAIKTQRWLEQAVGKQLDGCGYIAGVTRQGRNDPEYRSAIQAAILSNISNATPGALIEGLRFLTAPQEIQYLESYPACALLFTDGSAVNQETQIMIQTMASTALATVPIMVSYGHAPPLRLGKITQANQFVVSSSRYHKQHLSTSRGTLNLQASQPSGTSHLSGLCLKPAVITVNGTLIRTSTGLLSAGSYGIIDNGYRLPGVYQ